MKKYLSLFLVSLMVLVFLASCVQTPDNDVNSTGSSVPTDTTGQSDTTIQSNTASGSTVDSSQKTDECEHIWSQNEADQCEHLLTCSLCGEKSGKDVLHIYLDENGNSLEKCLNCGKQNDQYTQPVKTNTVTWKFNYTYWQVLELLGDEPHAELLVDYGYLRGGFESIAIPSNIVAGDTITINYTGYYTILETYPSVIGLQDGEVISYSFSYAKVIPVSVERIAEGILDYDAPNNYVILDRSGRYTTLDKFKGDTVYFVEDQSIQTTENSPLYVACMLAYDPRDLDDGIPVYTNISKNQAKQIACDHYKCNFYNISMDYVYEVVSCERLEDCWEVCIRDDLNECDFCYRIDSSTGKTISVGVERHMQPLEINTVTWQFTYDYGFHHEDIITLLVDYNLLRGGFEEIEIPMDITAGDTINIKYTGNYITNLKYPGHTTLYGEVISYTINYADVIYLDGDTLTHELLKSEYDIEDYYIICDRKGSFVSLEDYKLRDGIYLVVDSEKMKSYTEGEPLPIASVFGFNPRNSESGSLKITPTDAITTALFDFISKYNETDKSLKYSLDVVNSISGYWQVCIKKEYDDGTEILYTYEVDKTTGEIVNVIIDEYSIE